MNNNEQIGKRIVYTSAECRMNLFKRCSWKQKQELL